jgi:polyribonucleotide nucleotidyltransferase
LEVIRKMPGKVEGVIGGRMLVIEAGKFALQANGAVTVRYGDTVVLVTACASEEPREKVDFLPLTVDYEERLYAAGKIPGGFLRREGRPSQEAILASRLTDRPLRPLFPKGFCHDVQIVITVLSADQENSPEVLAIIGASAALTLSEIPFGGPVGTVRIGHINGQYVVNPTFSQLQESTLDLVVAGTREAVVMVEAGAREAPEEVVLGAIEFGQEINREIIQLQEQLQNSWGKPKKAFKIKETNPELELELSSLLDTRVTEIVSLNDKAEREVALAALEKELVEKLEGSYPAEEVISYLESRVKAEFRAKVLEQGVRPGGRGFAELRPISCEVGLLPRTHGSALFCRGQTQVLTITTLGSPGDEQLLDGLTQEESKRFIHHYNFPPYSTGEIRRLGIPSRREIGHGALVERALLPMIPDEKNFPYTIRLVSEVLSSNGSTSMASVCGSSLSLMDAGVPIKKPVAGVAMGLISQEGDKYAILTDIEGMEDAYGDMDFKVAGTVEGITAVQLDIKLKGIGYDVLAKALSQAREARLVILDKMQQTLAASRPELSRYAPRMVKITIDPHKIGNVIGPGGRTIRGIIEETKTTIDIENDGTVLIGSTTEEGAQKAIRMIESLTRDVEVGGIYTGKVTRLLGFGVMVEILPGKEGLVHISELADYRVSSVEDVVKVGDEIMVMVTGIDHQGRINLSRRAVFQGLSQVGKGAKVKNSLTSTRPAKKPPPPPPRYSGKGVATGKSRPPRAYHEVSEDEI